MSVYACRTHRGLIQGKCWHGKCPVCGRGVTAFDFSREDAQAVVDAHVSENHAPRSTTPEDRDDYAEEWLRARHTPEWYIGNATSAEWSAAYAAANEKFAPRSTTPEEPEDENEKSEAAPQGARP